MTSLSFLISTEETWDICDKGLDNPAEVVKCYQNSLKEYANQCGVGAEFATERRLLGYSDNNGTNDSALVEDPPSKNNGSNGKATPKVRASRCKTAEVKPSFLPEYAHVKRKTHESELDDDMVNALLDAFYWWMDPRTRRRLRQMDYLTAVQWMKNCCNDIMGQATIHSTAFEGLVDEIVKQSKIHNFGNLCCQAMKVLVDQCKDELPILFPKAEPYDFSNFNTDYIVAPHPFAMAFGVTDEDNDVNKPKNGEEGAYNDDDDDQQVIQKQKSGKRSKRQYKKNRRRF